MAKASYKTSGVKSPLANVTNLLDTKLPSESETPLLPKKRYQQKLTVTFDGYHNPNHKALKVNLAVSILNKYENRRVVEPFLVGIVQVACNPPETTSGPSITIAKSFFKSKNDARLVSSFLQIEVVKNTKKQFASPDGAIRKTPKTALKYDSAQKYSESLLIFDRSMECHLEEGGYYLVLQKKSQPMPKSEVWNTMSDTIDPLVLNVKRGPTVTFNIYWGDEFKDLANLTPSQVVNLFQLRNDQPTNGSEPNNIQIEYLIQHLDETQVEVCNHLNCNWCHAKFSHLPHLLVHLKRGHQDMEFKYNFVENSVKIKVEFKFDPGEHHVELERFHSAQASRQYHHSDSNAMFHPQEAIGSDSEEENDPEWLREKTEMMISDFIDINEGEMEVMKLWNLHVMNNTFTGVSQMKLACLMFVEKHGPRIMAENLYGNFVCHLSNLFDNGFLSAAEMYQITVKLQSCEQLPAVDMSQD